MRQIWKYQLRLDTYQYMFRFEIPAGAEIISCQVQDGYPTLWAMLDPTQSTETREFAVVGTGHSFAEEKLAQFVGTCQFGTLVLHVFEVAK